MIGNWLIGDRNRTTNKEQRTTNKEQPTRNNEQRTTNNEQRTTNKEQNIMDNEEILKSRVVLEMLTVANDFCIFTEGISSKTKIEIVEYYQKVLPLMYVKGSLLPDIEVSDPAANERYVAEQHWEQVYKLVEEKFGKDDLFWRLDNLNEANKNSIADHIADIYQDVKDFVFLFQQNRMAAKENAVSECKRLFESHWGHRCTRVIDALHYKKYEDVIDNSDSPII